MYNIGDIVRYKFDNSITGMVIGFADGSKLQGYSKTDRIVLAITDNSILAFLANNMDYDIVDHFDMKNIYGSIQKARS